MSHKEEHVDVLLHNFLNNPSSLFEHRIFTALGLFMRNLTEQLQDYRGYYYSLPDQFFNTSSVHFVDETEEEEHHVHVHHHHHVHEGLESSIIRSSSSSHHFTSVAVDVARVVVTIVCLLLATWFLNKRLVRSRVLQYGVELVACHLIILPTLPFIGSFFILIGLCRLGIWMHIQLFHKGKRFLVRPEDAFWAYEEFASSSASTAVYMIKGKCNPGKIREKVKQVVESPVVRGRMTRKLRDFCGFAIWEVCDWNVRDHVRIGKWPKKDNKSGSAWSDKDVLDFITTFQDKPLSKRRPGWEVILIPNLRMPGSEEQHYCCIFRMHHAMMDGISSANILHQVLGDKPFKFTLDPIEVNAKNKPGLFGTLCMYTMALFLLPRTGLVNGLLHLDNKCNRLFSPGETLKGPKHFSWSRPVKMEAIKTIKEGTKSSVMTVLLSSLGGSYRKMKESHHGKGGESLEKFPEFYHALTPVAMLPYPDRHPRNGFSGALLPVAMGKFSDPRDRLRVNHKALKDQNVGVMDVMGNFILINMVGLMPTVLHKPFERAIHLKLSLSNIPGSDEQITIFGGDPIVDMGAWLPCKFSLGMAMGLFSYGGRCRATMVGDETYLSKSDVEALTTNFEAEISSLGKSLGMSESDIFC